MSTTGGSQRRAITDAEVRGIQALIGEHPEWHRTRLSREVAERWQWYDATGRLKDMACRNLLLKLEQRGDLRLPARRRAPVNHRRGVDFQPVLHDTAPIAGALADLRPVRLITVHSSEVAALWQTLLRLYHYLGFTTRVGQSLRYLALDRHQRPVGALLFGAPAWKVAVRDVFIGWSAAQRQARLPHLVNNMRFLIPPWVRVPHLASHMLALAMRQLPADWQRQYGLPLYLAETFVDTTRFAGTCYQAANWRCVGQTTGRSRDDRYRRLQVPVKTVYVYPLHAQFRERLCQEESAHETGPRLPEAL